MVAPAAGAGQDSIETLYVDIAARADQLVTSANAAVAEVLRALNQLEQKNIEMERSYSRLGKFMEQAFATATGMIMAKLGGSLMGAITGLGRQLISTNAQMQQFTRSFEVLTGSAEEAGELINWVKEQAKKTPFDIPGLISASQMLMTWGLDIKEWFTIVGDTAAAMNRPLSMVVNAIGTLASGQTGEAVRRFRDLGVNLRQFSDQLQFDAQGSLITPLEQAIPIVRKILEDKYGGMMAAQAKTWSGVMSNMRDTWQQFVQVVGQPLFEKLNQSLSDLYSWIEANQDSITDFGQTMGDILGGTLDILLQILAGFSDLFGYIDKLLAKEGGLAGIWARGREVLGIGAMTVQLGAETIGGLAGGESWDEAAKSAAESSRRTMLEIGGHADWLGEKYTEVSEGMKVGLDAVRAKWGDVFKDITDEYLYNEMIAKGLSAEGVIPLMQTMEDLGVFVEGATEKFKEETAVQRELATVYQKAIDDAESLAKAKAAVAEQEAKIREQQQANLDLAMKVGAKLTEKLQELMKEYESTIEGLKAETAAAIEAIAAEATQAEAEALAKNQQEIAALRDNYARETLKRQRQFNQEWARLIREQQDANIDAEWEYQYRKQQLLIDGDEIALAELEATYAHESEVRARDQGQERDDTQQRYQEQEQERQQQFEQALADLQTRLQEEIEKIRAEAQEEKEAKQEALDERLADEDAKLKERVQKIGEMLADEISDNEYATSIILQAWQSMYGMQVYEAALAGQQVRAEMQSIIAEAIAAAAAIANVYAGYREGGRPERPRSRGKGVTYQTGGYTPSGPIVTDLGEWVATEATTQALEQAIGGSLTQGAVRALAVTSRRILDVNIRSTGVPANVLEQVRRELIDGMRESTGEY